MKKILIRGLICLCLFVSSCSGNKVNEQEPVLWEYVDEETPCLYSVFYGSYHDRFGSGKLGIQILVTNNSFLTALLFKDIDENKPIITDDEFHVDIYDEIGNHIYKHSTGKILEAAGKSEYRCIFIFDLNTIFDIIKQSSSKLRFILTAEDYSSEYTIWIDPTNFEEGLALLNQSKENISDEE